MMTYEDLVKNYRIEIVTEKKRLAGCRFLIVDAYNTPNTIRFIKRTISIFLLKMKDWKQNIWALVLGVCH